MAIESQHGENSFDPATFYFAKVDGKPNVYTLQFEDFKRGWMTEY